MNRVNPARIELGAKVGAQTELGNNKTCMEVFHQSVERLGEKLVLQVRRPDNCTYILNKDDGFR